MGLVRSVQRRCRQGTLTPNGFFLWLFVALTIVPFFVQWGSCQYCSDVLDQAPMEGDEYGDFYSGDASAAEGGSTEDEGAFVRFARGMFVLVLAVGAFWGGMRLWKRVQEGRPGEIKYQPVNTAEKGA